MFSDDEEKLWGCLGITLGYIATIVIGYILNGWVLTILWEWFVVSIFEYPSLSIPQAIGISIVIGFLTRQVIYTEDKRESLEKFVSIMIITLMSPLTSLVVGYIITLFL